MLTLRLTNRFLNMEKKTLLICTGACCASGDSRRPNRTERKFEGKKQEDSNRAISANCVSIFHLITSSYSVLLLSSAG